MLHRWGTWYSRNVKLYLLILNNLRREDAKKYAAGSVSPRKRLGENRNGKKMFYNIFKLLTLQGGVQGNSFFRHHSWRNSRILFITGPSSTISSTAFSSATILMALVTLSMEKTTCVSAFSHNFLDAACIILVESMVSQDWLYHNLLFDISMHHRAILNKKLSLFSRQVKTWHCHWTTAVHWGTHLFKSTRTETREHLDNQHVDSSSSTL